MTHGSLFSGIGGFDLAAEWMGWTNVFHCENEDWKRDFLKRFGTGYGDIRETDFTIYRGLDVLTGGFPCQDASIANQHNGQLGLKGGRTGLFWHMVRSIREIRPRYVVAENVANFLKVNGGSDFRTVLRELASMGYNAEWRICRASWVGAPHKRRRMYLVAYPDSLRLQKGETFLSNVSEKAQKKLWEFAGTTVPLVRGGEWLSEPPVLCLDDGVSGGLVRKHLHGYGNAIVPQIALKIFQSIQKHDSRA